MRRRRRAWSTCTRSLTVRWCLSPGRQARPDTENGQPQRLQATKPRSRKIEVRELQLYLTGSAGAADGHLAVQIRYRHAGVAVPSLAVGVELKIPVIVEEDIEMIVAVLEV